MIAKQNVGHPSSRGILGNACMNTVIALSLFLLPGVPRRVEAAETCRSRANSYFGYTWRKSSNLLTGLFGTLDASIYDHEDIPNIDAFEHFLRDLAVRTKVNLIKKVVRMDELSKLPKPAIIIRSDRLSFGVFLNSYDTDNGTVYQLLSSSSKPFLLDREQMIRWWSGEVWYVPAGRDGDLVCDIARDSKMRISGAFHNLGLIEAQPVGVRHFETTLHLRNVGKYPVKVSAIRTSCSCTVARIGSDEPVEPGGDTDIVVSLDIPTENEGVRYLVVVPFEDLKSNKSAYLRYEVIGNFVDDGLDIAPSQLRFVGIRDIRFDERTVRVSERGTARINNLQLGSSDGFLTARLDNTMVYDGLRTYYIKVSVDPQTVPRGKRVKGTVSISTDNPKYTGYSIPVEVTVPSRVQSIPSVVAYGFCKPDQVVSRTVAIESPDKESLSVRAYETTDDVKVVSKQNGDSLELTIAAHVPKSGFWKRDLKILFDKPEDAVLTIPLYAIVRGETSGGPTVK